MQEHIQEATTTMLKLFFPVTALSLTWAGISLSDWVLLFTLFYTVLLIIEQGLKIMKRLYGDNDGSDSRQDKPE